MQQTIDRSFGSCILAVEKVPMDNKTIQYKSIAGLLSNVAIFSGLSESELKTVVDYAEVVQYAENRELFVPGDKASHFYVVCSGSVDIIRADSAVPEGKAVQESLIARLLPGDSFGEMELLVGLVHNEIARVPEQSQLFLFPSRDKNIADVWASHPALGARMLFCYLRDTAARQRKAIAAIKENSPLVQELKKQVYGDKLTGLFNKTYLEEELPQLLKKHDKLALLMFKPDNFKQINDTYGHEAGDTVIVLMAAELARHTCEGDICVRYMGNELALVLPGRERDAAQKEAERIRLLMNELNVSSCTNNEPFTVTVSFGVSLFPDHAQSSSELIALAHELPLLGRSRGGNMILFPGEV